MKLLQKSALGLVRLKFRLMAALSPSMAARAAFGIFSTPQVRHRAEPAALFLQAEQLGPFFRGTQVRGYRWNQGAPVRAMVIHGFESSVVNFETYITALISKGYEVVAVDAPAHGKSGGRRLHVLDYRDFIHFLQQEYGPATRFVAHSVGALALCLAIAETKANDAMRLALIAPLTETTSTFRLFSDFLRLDQPTQAGLEKIIVRISGHNLQWFSITRAIRDIRSQVLWYHDRTDLITPFSDLDPVVKQNYPNLRFVFTDGLGHRRIYRDEEVIRTIIEFL